MLARTHVLCGSAFIVGASALQPFELLSFQGLWAFCGVFLGSLLPDLDHPKSYLGRRFFGLSLLVSKFEHRGFTHSLLFCSGCVFSLILATKLNYLPIPMPFIQGLFLGLLSHMACDILTNRGIKLFWPMSIWVSVPYLNMRTGSSKEFFVSFMILCLTLIMLIPNIPFTRLLAM